MKTDLEILKETSLENIKNIADKLGLLDDEYDTYGRYKAKIEYDKVIKRFKTKNPSAKIIAVTACENASKIGEGKTSVEISVQDAACLLGYSSIACLRTSSVGPTFGIKGASHGALYAQIAPEELNYDCFGDLSFTTNTINMIAAQIENTIYQGNELNINPDKIVWCRAEDICDRSLRDITVHYNDKKYSGSHKSKFVITTAHELLAIATLAKSEDDFINKLDNAIIAYTYDNKIVTVGDLKMNNCIRLLMRNALKPNLVQTLEHNPVLMGGGVFANVSTGTNPIMVTELARRLADDFVFVENGFASDCGFEKYANLVCIEEGIEPDVILAVCSCRSLKYHGNVDIKDFSKENVQAIKEGLSNLKAHIKHLRQYNIPIVVVINKFNFDTAAEIKVITDYLDSNNILWAISTGVLDGGKGSVDVINKINEALTLTSCFKPIYNWNEPIKDKIEKICKNVYGATGINYSELALKQIENYTNQGYNNLAICMSKTPNSITSNELVRGAPEKFNIDIREVLLYKGAGYLVVCTGTLNLMPGLSKLPRLRDDWKAN